MRQWVTSTFIIDLAGNSLIDARVDRYTKDTVTIKSYWQVENNNNFCLFVLVLRTTTITRFYQTLWYLAKSSIGEFLRRLSRICDEEKRYCRRSSWNGWWRWDSQENSKAYVHTTWLHTAYRMYYVGFSGGFTRIAIRLEFYSFFVWWILVTISELDWFLERGLDSEADLIDLLPLFAIFWYRLGVLWDTSFWYSISIPISIPIHPDELD